MILRTGQPMPLEDDEARRLLACLPDTVRVVAAPEAETCGHETEWLPRGCAKSTPTLAELCHALRVGELLRHAGRLSQAHVALPELRPRGPAIS